MDKIRVECLTLLTVVEPMPAKEPRLAARCSEKLRRRIDRALKATNLSETDFLITSVEEFLTNHPTTPDKIHAVVARHLNAAAETESAS